VAGQETSLEEERVQMTSMIPGESRTGGYGSSQTSVIVLLPKLLIIFASLTLIVDGAVPQLEMAITGGTLPFMPRQFTLLILGMGCMLLLRKRFQSSPLLPLFVVLSAYCLCEALFLHFCQSLGFGAIRSALEYVIFLLLVGLASVVPLRLNARHILGLLYVITIVCVILSAAQFLTNSPIVRTESTDQVFRVQSYQFLNETRGFSFFANGLEAGIFYSFMGGVATSLCLRRGTRRYGFLLLPLCAFGCYATYTRLAMVGFVVCAFSVFVMSIKGLSRFTRLLPVFAFCCAVLVIVQGLRTLGGAGRNDLANISSLDQRVLDWGIYTGKFMSGSPTDILFGTGQGPYTPYSSKDRPENASPIPVDNTYLLVLLSSGISGLFLLGITYWQLWLFLTKRAGFRREPLLVGITGIFASVPFFCSISDPPIQITLLLLLAVSLEDGEGAMVTVPAAHTSAARLRFA
jgi:hypothetical protein